MMATLGWFTLAAVVGGLVLIFLAGMLSAAWEIRAERRAGVPVTRPAREARHARRVQRDTQGRLPYLRGLVKGLRS